VVRKIQRFKSNHLHYKDMKEKISPTTTPNFEKGESYVLEDKDYLLIKAINNIANEIKKARIQNG